MTISATRIIIGNAFAVLQYLAYVYAYYRYNEKTKVIVGDIVSCSFAVIANLILGAIGGVVTMVVGLLSLIAIYYKEKLNKDWLPVFVALSVLFLFTFSEWRGLATLLLVFSQFLVMTSKWFCKRVQLIRLGGLIGNLTIIPYNLIVMNYVGCIIATLNIISLSISLLKWKTAEE